MSAHTPGPWRVDKHAFMVFAENPYKHDLMHIADIRGWGHLTGTGGGCGMSDEKAEAIQRANADLIAAAPDMLAALKALVAQFQSISDHQHGLLVEGQNYASASANWDEATLGQYIDFGPAIAAIAKAEGR